MTNSKLELEVCRLTDELSSEFISLMDEYRVFYGKRSNPDETASYARRLLMNDNAIFLAAVANRDKVVGFCTLFASYSTVRADRIFILNDLYVCKEYRRCGCGSKLLDSAVSLAASEGIRFLKLETAKDNHVAQRVYRQHGWKPSGLHSYGFEVDDGAGQ